MTPSASNLALEASPGFTAKPGHGFEFSSSPRWVRAEIDGTIIASSTRAMLLREERRAPVYYFSIEDIRMDLMDRSRTTSRCEYKGEATYWTARLGYRVVEDVLWTYETPYLEASALRGYVALNWRKVDHWYEEDEEIFLHARDPKRRVDVVASKRIVEIELGGKIVAHSGRALFLFETRALTRYYLPPEDVRMELLLSTASTSTCPYKGTANYFDANIDGKRFDDIAWCYADPIAECPRIKGLIAFYNERVDAVRIDGQRVPTGRPVLPWR